MVKAIQAMKIDFCNRCDRLLGMIEADGDGLTQETMYSTGYVDDPMRPLLEKWLIDEKRIHTYEEFIQYVNPPGAYPRPIEDMVYTGIGYRLSKAEIMREAQSILGIPKVTV